MPATPSPNADDRPAGDGRQDRDEHGSPEQGPPDSRRPRLRLLPRTFRGRLALVISAVVAFALLLVLAVVPRLLVAYFEQQETQNLQARATAVGELLYQELRNLTRPGTVAIVAPTNPATVSDQVVDQLARREQNAQRSYLEALAQSVAQADLKVTIHSGPSASSPAVGSMSAQAVPGPEGETRENTSISGSFQIPDPYWSQYAQDIPVRTVSVTLASPYTLRNQTLGTVFTALALVAVTALLVAVLVAFLVADRLTTPLRRVIRASRSLAEGNLDARVSVPASGTPEIDELAVTFNRMADRLQESIELIRRDRDRSRDFLAEVSHELRTPIAALRTFNELLQDGADDDSETRQEFLETSRQQIERLDWLAANLLELSKLDSGLIALDLRPDDLRAVIESAILQAEPGARRKGLELTAELPPEPLRQRHDPQRLGQVVSNLISNAVKFTPRGGSVTVGLRPTREGAQITVRDTGVGIDAAELPHVFDRFYRGTRANEMRAAGSGLGLSIARSIVEMHGGRIAIASTLGTGTQVDVYLPRDLRPRDVTESSPADTPGMNPRPSGSAMS